MKYILLFSILLGSALGQLTYPVDVVNDRFTVIKDGEVVDRGRPWPRADGMEIQDLTTGVVILKEVISPLPAFDPATEKLGPGEWTDDIPSATATFSRPVVALDQAELDAVAENADLSAKGIDLANAVVTLRAWAVDLDTWAGQAETAAVNVTSGNAVATLKSTLERLAVIYAREAIFKDRFADLLEVQRIGE